MTRRTAVVLLVLVATVAAFGATGFSSATFSATSTSGSTVAAAADWTPPTVAVTAPAAAAGTVEVSVAAHDADSAVATVEVQRRTAAGWVTICTDTEAPYTCSWDTTQVADGARDLRARATDTAGNTATSAVVSTTVVNAAGVALARPGGPDGVLRGTVPLTATITAGAGLDWRVTIQRAAAGSGAWTDVCAGLAAPYECAWATTAATTGRHDLRAVATAGGVTLTSPVVRDVLVDNVAPTVTMTDPGAPLTGTVTLAATAADAHSGVASVVFQVGPSATGTFRDLCTARSQPFNCQADTTGLPYGSTFFRAVVTDRAGNTTTSAPVGPRLVDNTTRSVTLADPGMFLEGTVTLTASPAASAGITSVSFQQRRTGTTAWTVICTPTAAPWTCDWDTRTVADGRYDVRAVLVDANGNEAVSEVATSRLVDNVTTPFRGVDVQTTNGGRAGEVDRGDTLVHTFSRRVDLGTITPGWDGTPLPVRLEVRDSGAFTDDVVITRPGPTVNLGHVRVTAGLIGLFHSHATFEATLVASTETVDGLPRTVVTVRVGSLVSGGTRDMTFSSDMTWHPVAAVRSLGSQALDTSAVAESGSKDRDF